LTLPRSAAGGLPVLPPREGAGPLRAFVSRMRFRLLLPLGGEGRDKGVAWHQEQRLLQARAACPLTPTLSPDGEGAGTPRAFVSRMRFRLLLPLGGEGREEGVAQS